jgi:hypothetical protein
MSLLHWTSPALQRPQAARDCMQAGVSPPQLSITP